MIPTECYIYCYTYLSLTTYVIINKKIILIAFGCNMVIFLIVIFFYTQCNSQQANHAALQLTGVLFEIWFNIEIKYKQQQCCFKDLYYLYLLFLF